MTHKTRLNYPVKISFCKCGKVIRDDKKKCKKCRGKINGKVLEMR